MGRFVSVVEGIDVFFLDLGVGFCSFEGFLKHELGVKN